MKKYRILMGLLVLVIAGCMRMPFEPVKNQAPDTPVLRINTHFVEAGAVLEMDMRGKDPDDDMVTYQIKLANPENSHVVYSNWTPYFASGKNILMGLQCDLGSYIISLRCKDDRQAISPFSDTLHVSFGVIEN